MPLPIDTISYNKAKAYPLDRDPDHGYELREHSPTGILVHTTGNKAATTLDHELNYLQTSRRASAHYLISKAGAIYQFLDPRTYAAWHAGQSLVAFGNQRSIGIEMHVSEREKPTAQQLEALTALVRDLMRRFNIIPQMVETHRFAARPVGRRTDPTGISDAQFYAWRVSLTIRRYIRRYRFRDYQPALSSNDVRVAHLAPSVTEWFTFKPGDVVEVDDVTGGMAHIARGVTVEVGPVGFVPLAVLEAM